MDSNGAIGKDNKLLWSLPLDMAYFKQTTLGHSIITGRKNYESIPEKYRPLKDRNNIVLTYQNDYKAPGSTVVNSIHEALSSVNSDEVYIIGGGQIYRSFLEAGLVDEILITHVDHEFEADIYFPEFELSQWNQELIAHYSKDEKHLYDFKMVRYFKK